ALDGVDLRVARGEIRAVIGPNGAGKSSLINVVSGLYRPDRGVVRLGVEEFAHVPTARLAAHGVARTFQNLALFKGLPVLDNVLMGLV
ncbi:ATP-binding cassette domain-containing protein, partial [Devosia neptuniae]|uniref:ATP-binding cassette domain-containing protein n=1 Tax=Devosia neptuniae TaxID=191302 RepID=UPI0022AF78D4